MTQLSVSQPKGDSRLPAGTLVRVLVQSLHTADGRLLDSVLDNSARSLVVRDTVLLLPPAYVLPLLQQLLARMQQTPLRAARLLPWMRATLAMHSAYLVSVPALVPQLAGFANAIEARLESQAALLKLCGRLDLAAASFKAADSRRLLQTKAMAAESATKGEMAPINVYKEDEDEEDDEEGDGEEREGSSIPPTPEWQAEVSTEEEDSDDDVDVEEESDDESVADSDSEMASSEEEEEEEEDEEEDDSSDDDEDL
ncbi:WD repeat-containing protein 43 [Coemansia aciculifera]|nr:WD repeat-containing protein 43 [Coemansia aciculifera]